MSGIGRRIMAWLFPGRSLSKAQRRLDGAMSERALAGKALSVATNSAAAEANRNAHEAARITERAKQRIAEQATRRDRAARERGIVLAIDDVLKLRSFGGPGEGEV